MPRHHPQLISPTTALPPQRCLQYAQRTECEPLRCAARAAAVVETGMGEFLSISPDAPVLVRLHERPWGALANLPSSKLVEAGFTGQLLVVRVCVGGGGHRPRKRTVASLGAGGAAATPIPPATPTAAALLPGLPRLCSAV